MNVIQNLGFNHCPIFGEDTYYSSWGNCTAGRLNNRVSENRFQDTGPVNSVKMFIDKEQSIP